MSLRVAFIGLGIMGLPMAGHLLAGGHRLVVHSRTQSKADGLLALGAVWADSPASAAEHADIVFTCVTDTPDVQAVILGDKGIASVDRPGLIVVDHSTISPSTTKAMAAELTKKGQHLLDAPVSGGDLGARNATLSIMVGGDEAAYRQVLPLLQLMGKTITYCGQSGSGQLTKLVNQIIGSVTNLAVAEGLSFAIANGLDPQKTLDAVSGGAASSWQLQNLGPKMLQGDFAPGFMIDLQQKDLRLVMEAASQSKSPVLAVALVKRLLGEAQTEGWGKEGTQALFRVLRSLGS